VVTTVGDQFPAISEFREGSFHRIRLRVAIPLRDGNRTVTCYPGQRECIAERGHPSERRMAHDVRLESG
jgi:hypothetical protein